MNKNEIEILIPTFNEEGNISQVIKDLNFEGFNNITILDANSPDATVLIAKQNNCKIILDEPGTSGFGTSVMNGLKKLDHKYFCIFDGDNSFDPKSIVEMMNEISKGADFVFGSRYLNGTKSDDDTLVTQFGNFFFTKLVNILFRIKTSDVLFLYVVGKRENVDKLELKQKDYTICAEFLVKSYKNFKCKEVLSKERKRLFGVTKVNRFFDGVKILKHILLLFFSLYEKK